MLRVFVSGQKSFGAAALAMCLEESDTCRVVGVASPALSGEKEDPLMLAARAAVIPWFDAATLKPQNIPAGTDVIIAAHTHAFLDTETRRRARFGALGYHPSMLPLHRGRDAVRWVIHMRERMTGGTVYWMTDQVDAGPIQHQLCVFVHPDDTASSLWNRDLFPLGIRLLREVLVLHLPVGMVQQAPQDEELATWEPAFSRPPLRAGGPA